MVRDLTDADFATLVVEGSRTRPAVVDFWATWCAPCRQLSPMIERIGGLVAGHVDTYKMDVDANPQTSAAMGIKSIPTVVAFRNGVAVDAFLGAQPEQAVRAFFDRLLPTEDDLLVESRPGEGELREVLSRRPDHRGAILQLAALAEPDEARALLARIPEDDEVRKLLASIELASGGSPDLPDTVREGVRLAGAGNYEAALAALLDAVRSGEKDAGRAAMVDVFAVLGDDHPLVMRYRRELASALF